MIRLSRRRFLGMAATLGVGAGIGLPLVSGVFGATSTGVRLTSQLPLPTPFTVPLTIPPVLDPTRVDATTDYYAMVQRPSVAEILPGIQTPIWTYNGSFPGPTLHVRRGR